MTDNGTKGTIYDQVQVDLDSTTHKAHTSQDITLYWYWPYVTDSGATEIASNDIIDTADGVNQTPMSFDITLTAWQVTPEENNGQGGSGQGGSGQNEVVQPLEIGDKVETFSTQMGGVTLSNWHVLDVAEENGVSYTYLISDEYLPNSAIAGISDLIADESSNYSVGPASSNVSGNQAKEQLYSALNNHSYWSALITNATLNGNPITSNQAYAIGSPTIEMFISSWNKSCTNPNYQLSATIGTYYNVNIITMVDCDERLIREDDFYDRDYKPALRPVVCIPTSLF